MSDGGIVRTLIKIYNTDSVLKHSVIEPIFRNFRNVFETETDHWSED